MLLRLAYLGITSTFALLRLPPGSDRDKDAEILALRHQLAVLQRQLDGQRVRFDPADRAWLAAPLHQLPRPSPQGPRLLVRPDTVPRWHRDLVARRHTRASRPRRRGRPPTMRSIRALILRLVAENPSWGIGRVHGELLTLEVKVAASTMWEILREAGIDPAPDRAGTTWTQFPRSQAETLLAADVIETITLTGTRIDILAVIEHASRRIRILGARAHPTAAWVTPVARNLMMDLEDADCQVKYLIRDRDGTYPAMFDEVLADASIEVVRSGVRAPRMNSIMDTKMPLDLHGRGFRQAHRQRRWRATTCPPEARPLPRSRGRVVFRLVEHHLPGAGDLQDNGEAPAFVSDVTTELGASRGQMRHGLVEVVTHQRHVELLRGGTGVALVLPAARMHSQLTRAGLEDQPTGGRADTREFQDITKESSRRVGVVGVDQRVHCGNHGRHRSGLPRAAARLAA